MLGKLLDPLITQGLLQDEIRRWKTPLTFRKWVTDWLQDVHMFLVECREVQLGVVDREDEWEDWQ